jgi:hypothetical protein
MALAACGSCGHTADSPTPFPSVSPAFPSPFAATSQPFNLFTHCGILTTRISGRTFFLAELYPARVPIAGNPVEPGTMTMITTHVAEFTDAEGNHIRFVDQLPGQLNQPYPFTVHVLDGGNQLIDEGFAGRRWQTHDTLPGVVGPPYGNGRDRFTMVNGTFTLINDSEAVFKSDAGAVAHFMVLPPAGCD